MDRRFSSSDWLIVIGAIVLLVASVLPWWVWRNPNALRVALDGYEFGLTGIVPIVLLVLVAVLIVTVKTGSLQLPDWVIHPYVSTAVVCVAAIGIGVRFFWSGYEDTAYLSRGLGLYLAAAGVVIALIGCVVGIRDRRRRDGTDTVAAERDDDDDDDEVDLDEDDLDEDIYGYVDDVEEDDLVRRYNAALPTGETSVQRPTKPAPPPRRLTPRREPTARRRTAADPPLAPPRRRSSGPPLP